MTVPTVLLDDRPFVKRFALCYRSVVCPVCMSRWCIMAKRLDEPMPLDGMEEGLGPAGHIVLDGDPDPSPPERGTAAPTFRPMSIVAKRLNGSRCHLVWR